VILRIAVSHSMGGYSRSDRLEIVDPGVSGEADFPSIPPDETLHATEPLREEEAERNEDFTPKMEESSRRK